MYREQAIAFGPNRSLVGIITSPRNSADDNRPAVVFLNSGLIHRVGVNRLHVQLARAFAEQGFPSLRFDFSGIGDSARAQDSVDLAESVTIDIQAALDHLRTKGKAARFILMGLCSGAYDAFVHAVDTEEVAGLILLDLPGPFRNWQHLYHHYKGRLFRWESWKHTLFAPLPAVLRARGMAKGMGENGEAVEEIDSRPPHTREKMEKDFQSFLERDGSVLMIFTGGVESEYNHASQFQEVFPAVASDSRVNNHFFGDSDHVFGDIHHRQSLESLVSQWLSTTF